MKVYEIDLTSQELTDKSKEFLSKNSAEGCGATVQLSKGVYSNPPMKAKIVVRYKNGTLYGKIKCVHTFKYSYEVTVLYDSFKDEMNSAVMPEMIPTARLLY